jgi:cell division protein FtsB
VQRITHSRDWRSRLQQLVVLLCCCAATSYFVHHALYGRHGFEVRQRLIERSSMLDLELASLEVVRARLRRDVDLLQREPPAPDIVEDIARDVLGFAHPADRIIRR